jgi:hypothetical protein
MASKIDSLHKKLVEVNENYNKLVKCGVSREILQVYLAHKCGISMKKAKQVLDHTDEFYEQLVVSETIENL